MVNKMRKVAIVTGASRGIGEIVAKRLAEDGFDVVVNYFRDVREAEMVVADITAKGGKAIAVKANISKAAEVVQLFEAAEHEFGGVDVLINNAGVATPKPFHIAETDEEWYDRVFNTNTKGSFLTLREAAKRLRDGGRIVNFSTSAIGLAMPGYAIYAGSKAAVELFTLIMAKEMRGRNITVNAVAPGPTGTELFFQGKSEEVIHNFAKMPPLERLGMPEDIANVVSFLVGPEGGWINGQTLHVNGGIA